MRGFMKGRHTGMYGHTTMDLKMRPGLIRLLCSKMHLQGRKLALLMVVILLAGITTTLAVEGTVKVALKDLYEMMTANKATAASDNLDVQVLENDKAAAVKEAAKIFNVGVYEQGFDNTLTRDVAPLEADSRIAAEKLRQTQAPVGRERDLYKAIQSLILLREQQKLEEKLLLLTREEANTARIRYDAGILVEADLRDAEAVIESAVLNLDKLRLSIDSATLEVKSQAGSDFSNELAQADTDTIALLISTFSDTTKVDGWITAAQQADVGVFEKSEALRLLDMKLEIAKKFIPDTNDRVILMRRDREDARLALLDAKAAIEVNLRNRLNDRLTAMDQLDLAKKDLELAKRHQAQAQLKLNAGIFGRTDMISRERDVMQATYAIVSATASLNSQEADLRALIGDKVLP